MPQTEISTLTYNLPKLVNENGGQTRIFIPKYGNINERRHQLHEVIRLSGINLIIDDMDMPLIIKVASIPKERMQVYFIDSEDYFKGRSGYSKDENNKLYKDNDERSIFFSKGVIETIKKLNWAPDLIHVHGWIASLLPLYMKYYYKDDPIFDGTKVVVSLYENALDGKMDKNFVKKIKYDEIDDSNLTLLNESTYENLYKIALKYAAKNVEYNQVLKDLETIIYSGTKLNLRYIIDDLFDEESHDELLDFFNDLESDDIQIVLDEFEDEYEEEDLKLFRLYHYCEIGF